jgi:V/A-type H+-transporting ATPase subunit K
MTGLSIAILGLALSAIMCGIGSGLGLKASSAASAGVLAEDPSKFSKILVMTLLPATQGIYGFVIAIMGLGSLTAVTAAATPELALSVGWNIFFAAMPMAIVGCLSAILQGQTAAATIVAVGKKPEIGGKSILFPAMIEFYALLGLVVSIMLLAAV